MPTDNDKTQQYLKLFGPDKTRKLTDEEWNALAPVTQGIIPKDQITYAWTKTPSDVEAQVPVGTSTIESRYLGVPPSVLAHEATHVLQNESPTYSPGDYGRTDSRFPVVSNPKDPYDYGGKDALTAYHKLGVPVEAFAREQQGRIVENYMEMLESRDNAAKSHVGNALTLKEVPGWWEKYLPTYAHYTQQIKNRTIERQSRSK